MEDDLRFGPIAELYNRAKELLGDNLKYIGVMQGNQSNPIIFKVYVSSPTLAKSQFKNLVNFKGFKVILKKSELYFKDGWM